MVTLENSRDVETGISRNEEVAEIYEEIFPAVAKLISSTGGSFEDAKDIFHDALVIFIEKTTDNPQLIIKSNRAYILGISRHLWIRKCKKDSLKLALDGLEKEMAIPDDYFPKASNKRLLEFLKIVGARCLDLLRAFYFQQCTIKDIADNLGYSNQHSVSAQKYKCLEKLRNTIKNKSYSYDDFTE